MNDDPVRRVLDSALEIGIAPSFTRIGPAVRRRLWKWESPAPGSLLGEVVVVTGATAGLGEAIALGLAPTGAHLVLVGRNAERGGRVLDAVTRAGATGRFISTDLSDAHAMDDLLVQLSEHQGPIRALVHNAGALVDHREVNALGIEQTWYAMVVAPHRITRHLADRTDRAIWMSSGGMYTQAVDLDDLGWERRPWNGSKVYAQAKRAQVDLVIEATRRAELPLQVAMHPGWADTPGVATSLPGFHRVVGPLLRSPAQGADTAIWLVASDREALEPGAFYLDRRPRGTVRLPGTATSSADRSRLRALVDEQADLTTP